MDKYLREHTRNIERICSKNGLKMIGENPCDVRILIKEPVIEKIGWGGLYKTPDIFIGKYNNIWTVAELKKSQDRRNKAYIQVENGIRELVDIFGIPSRNITGKFVVYGGEKITYEIFK